MTRNISILIMGTVPVAIHRPIAALTFLKRKTQDKRNVTLGLIAGSTNCWCLELALSLRSDWLW